MSPLYFLIVLNLSTWTSIYFFIILFQMDKTSISLNDEKDKQNSLTTYN